MAELQKGNEAPYDSKNPETTWCTDKESGTLTSTSFGSCVGLVLYNPEQKIGAVAHFPGSTKEGTAKKDAQQIVDKLRELYPDCKTGWNIWVFGGNSLNKGFAYDTTTESQTKLLIDTVRGVVKGKEGLPVNFVFLPPPEMKDLQYVAHEGVKLNLKTGKVTWLDKTQKEKTQTYAQDF